MAIQLLIIQGIKVKSTFPSCALNSLFNVIKLCVKAKSQIKIKHKALMLGARLLISVRLISE